MQHFFANIPGSLAAFVAALTMSLSPAATAAEPASAAARAAKPIPVILTTDIGDDIDDTWALALLLKSPELDSQLVIGDHGKALYRAKLLAKFLEAAGRTDIPVGIGPDVNKQGDGFQAAWVKDYDLKKYPGKVYEDGVQAMIDIIMRSPEPVTILAIGPVPNLRLALEREPRIAEKARVVGMHGSVRKGYGGSQEIHAEYNVKEDARSCQKALSATWPVTITPLDTCGLIDLGGEQYARVKNSQDPVAAALIANYRLWSQAQTKPGATLAADTKSSILFDTVAVYLAFRERGLTMENLGIRVTDDGFTRLDSTAKQMRVATEWTDLPGYREFLVERLTGPTVKPARPAARP